MDAPALNQPTLLQSALRQAGISSSGGATLSFHALDTSAAVHVGTGGLTTTHTATIYGQNESTGDYDAFAANDPVWTGSWLHYVPAATNNCLDSNNLTTVNWALGFPGTRAFDQVGLTGAANSATRITDNSSGATYLQQNFGANTKVTAVCYIEKETFAGHYPAFGFSAPGYPKGAIQINPETGATGVYTSGITFDDYEVIDDGNHWKILIEDSAYTSGGAIRIFPAHTNTLNSAPVNSVTGSCTIANVEIYLNKSIPEVRGLPPIFTTSAAVSIDKTVYSFDSSNNSNDNGAWFVEALIPGTRVSGAMQGLIGAYESFSYFAATEKVTSWDGTNGATSSSAYTDGVAFKAGHAYHAGDGQKGSVLNSGWGENTYDGTMAKTGIAPGSGNTVPMKFKNLRRYDITSYQEGKDTIDGLMA